MELGGSTTFLRRQERRVYERIATDWVEFSENKVSSLSRTSKGHQAVVAKKIHNNHFIRLFCEVFYPWSEYNRPFQVIDMDSLQKELAKIQVTAPDINSLP